VDTPGAIGAQSGVAVGRVRGMGVHAWDACAIRLVGRDVSVQEEPSLDSNDSSDSRDEHTEGVSCRPSNDSHIVGSDRFSA